MEKQASMLSSLDTGSGGETLKDLLRFRLPRLFCFAHSLVGCIVLLLGAAMGDSQQSLYPSPLVSRQQLTVLREEPQHPRAFSFSGHTQEPLRGREVRSRAMSLSTGGGMFGDRNDVDLSTGGIGPGHGEAFHRPDAAGRYFDHSGAAAAVDDLAEIERQQGHRLESLGHESWPQHPRSHPGRSFFSPPAPMFAAQPQFHPVRAEDVAANVCQSMPRTRCRIK